MRKIKAYIITLKWGIWEKRLFFEGEDSSRAQKKFNDICRSIELLGGSSTDVNDFYAKSIELFRNGGFERIAK